MTTAKEKRHMDMVAGNGCIICGAYAEIHHIREGQGMSQRASNYLTIGLCMEHHRGDLSIHGSKRQFEKLYGDELTLLAKTIEMLAE